MAALSHPWDRRIANGRQRFRYPTPNPSPLARLLAASHARRLSLLLPSRAPPLPPLPAQLALFQPSSPRGREERELPPPSSPFSSPCGHCFPLLRALHSARSGARSGSGAIIRSPLLRPPAQGTRRLARAHSCAPSAPPCTYLSRVHPDGWTTSSVLLASLARAPAARWPARRCKGHVCVIASSVPTPPPPCGSLLSCIYSSPNCSLLACSWLPRL